MPRRGAEREREIPTHGESELPDKKRKKKKKKKKRKVEESDSDEELWTTTGSSLPSHGEGAVASHGEGAVSAPPKKKKKKKKRKKEVSSSDDDSDSPAIASPVSAPAKKKRKKKKKEDSSDDDDDDDIPKILGEISDPDEDPEDMGVSQLKEELEKRDLVTTGTKKKLIARLNKDLKTRACARAERRKKKKKKKDDCVPEEMNVAALREKCDELGLDSVGAKRLLIHRVRTELNRLSGKSTTDFNANLLTIPQLKKWLDKHGVEYDTKGKKKNYYVGLVEEAVEEEDEDRKENDVASMSKEELIQWLTEHGIDLPKKKKKREYYVDLVESNMGEDSALLYKEDEILHHKKLFFGQRLVVVKGDLTQCPAGAIVHPTNGDCVLGGGVGQALARASGKKFKAGVKAYIKANGKLSMTECCITEGHELVCENVIHTYSPVYSASDPEGSATQLHDSITNILQVCESEDLTSCALPSIGSGVNGYPADVAAETILKSIQDFFQTKAMDSNMKEVYFVLYDEASVDVYSDCLVNI